MKINGLININSFFPVKKNDSEKNEIEKVLNSEDNLQISKDAQEFHAVALKTNEIINEIDDLQSAQVKQIKERIQSGYYNTDEVINDIAANMLEKDEYQNLFMTNDTMDIVEEYIDAREIDIEKTEASKNNILSGYYQQDNIYREVAEEVINIYT